MNIFTSQTGKPSRLKASFNLVLLSVALVAVFWLALSRVGVAFDFSFLPAFKIRILQGYLATIYMSVASLFLSLFLGIISAVLQSSKILVLRYLAKLYITVIRGTPLMVQLLLFFFIVFTAMGVNNPYIAGILILSLFEGAYIAEIIRGSLLSMGGAQLEAAKAVGFTKRQITTLVVLPQLMTRTLPPLTGQFASIIKDSSLLSLIAVIEITQTMREISATNWKLFECYFTLGILYLILTLPISFVSKRLEARYSYAN